MSVARLGDRSPTLALPARVLRGHETGEAYERGRGREPVEVADLRGDGHRRQRVNDPEAPEPCHLAREW